MLKHGLDGVQFILLTDWIKRSEQRRLLSTTKDATPGSLKQPNFYKVRLFSRTGRAGGK